MRPSTFAATHISLLLLFLLGLKFFPIRSEQYTVQEIVLLFNKIHKFETNVFLKLKSCAQQNDYEEILRVIEVPRLLITELERDVYEIRQFSSQQCLTVVYMDSSSQQAWFELIDKLLWKLHLTNILIIWQPEDDQQQHQLIKTDLVFQQCWQKGLVNVMLWHQKHLFTYNPYPQVQSLHLAKFSDFANRSYLYNQQHFAWKVPFFQYPPRVFSFINRHGQFVRSGLYFKMIELFIRHLNGTMNIYEADIWSANLTQAKLLKLLQEKGFHFITTAMFRDASYESSDVLLILNRLVIVPAAKEIDKSLYITKPFKKLVWLTFFFTTALLFALVQCEAWLGNRQSLQTWLPLAEAIIYDLPFKKLYCCKIFALLLMLVYLVATCILENLYNSNLSSLLVTKLFEAELKTLEDIGKTNLLIHEHSVNIESYKARNFPAIIYRRLTWGNNTLMFYNRRNLAIDLNIYCISSEVADYYFSQQRNLRHPKVKVLDQSLFGQAFYISVANRLPVLDQFNRFLLHLKESGLYTVLKKASYLDGLISGDLKFFQDDELNHSFSLEHFRWAFGLWLMGLLLGCVCLLLEIRCKKKLFIAPTK